MNQRNYMKIDLLPAPMYLLGILFVGLKLTNFIGWSWWWVTLPFWAWVVAFTLGLLFSFLCALTKIFIVDLLQNRKAHKKRSPHNTDYILGVCNDHKWRWFYPKISLMMGCVALATMYAQAILVPRE